MGLRKLVLSVDVLDHASKALGSILGLSDNLDGRNTTINLNAEDKASKTMKNVQDAADKLASSTQKGSSSMWNFSSTSNGLASAMGSAGKMVEQAATKQSLFNRVSEQAVGFINNNSEAIKSLEGNLSKLALPLAGITAMFGLMVHSGIAEAESVDSIKKSLGSLYDSKDAESLGAFIDDADKVKYAAKSTRADMVAMLGGAGVKADKTKQIVEGMEKYYKKFGKSLDPTKSSLKDYESEMKAFSNGHYESMNKFLKGNAITTEQIKKNVEDFRKIHPEYNEVPDSVLENLVAQDTLIKILNKDTKDFDATTDSTDTNLTKWGQKWSKVISAIGDIAYPVMDMIYGMLNLIFGLIDKVPGGTKLVALVAILFTLGTALAAAAAILPMVVGALFTLSAVTGVTSGGLTALAIALGVVNKEQAAASLGGFNLKKGMASLIPILRGVGMAAWTSLGPIGIALIVIGGILAYVAYKTGILGKIWDYIANMDIGGKLTSGVEGAKGVWDSFTGSVMRVWDTISGFGKKVASMPGFTIALAALFPIVGIIGVLKLLYKSLGNIGKPIDIMKNFVFLIYLALKPLVDASITFFTKTIPMWIDRLIGFVNKNFGFLFKWGQSVYEFFKPIFQGMWETLKKILQKVGLTGSGDESEWGSYDNSQASAAFPQGYKAYNAAGQEISPGELPNHYLWGGSSVGNWTVKDQFGNSQGRVKDYLTAAQAEEILAKDLATGDKMPTPTGWHIGTDVLPSSDVYKDILANHPELTKTSKEGITKGSDVKDDDSFSQPTVVPGVTYDPSKSGSASVEGWNPLNSAIQGGKMVGGYLGEKADELGNWWNGEDASHNLSGSYVEKSGLAYVDKGEILPAKRVIGKHSLLGDFLGSMANAPGSDPFIGPSAAANAATSSKTVSGGKVTYITVPVRIDKVDGKVDLNKLKTFIQATVVRTWQQLEG